MICGNCGHEILEGSKFCINCGAKIEEAVSVDTGVNEEAVSPVEGPDSPEADGFSSVDETLNSAQEAYEQAASDLSDTADQAMGNDSSSSASSSGFYESSETYTDYSENYEEEGGGSIGFAIASLVCGCLSILCCVGGCISWIFSIVAIVMGIITITKKYDGRGFAIAGLITGGVGILLSIIIVAAMVSEGVLNEIM
ncbi:MAG TPA: hypothetical protein DIS78_07930 [Lachnospiraceae bacterium]|nr:hypothetical protein [Lachnospiraceae bacterium]